MSASRERKKRLVQEENPAPEKKTKKKLSEGVILAISVVLVLALVIGGILGYRAYWRNATVMKVNDHKISVKEFNYFYCPIANSFRSQIGNNSSSMVDLGLSDLLIESAKNSIAQCYTLYDEGKAKGFEASEEDMAVVEETMAQYKAQKDQYNQTHNTKWDLDEYIAAIFGKGCNEKGLRCYLERTAYADAYANSLTYTDEEIQTAYEADKTRFDVATYDLYKVAASDYIEEGAESTEVTDAEKEKAKAAAEAMEKEFDAESDKVTHNADRTQEGITSAVNEDAAKWVFETAAAGDAKLFVNEAGDTYYVIKLIDKEDYATANLLQLVYCDTEDSTSHSHDYTPKEIEVAVNTAMSDKTDADGFRKLAEQYSENDTVDVENVTRSGAISYSEDVYAWLFNEERTAGDCKSFEVTNNGEKIHVVLYYTGAGKMQRALSVSNGLKTDHVEGLVTAAVENCDFSKKAVKHANLD